RGLPRPDPAAVGAGLVCRPLPDAHTGVACGGGCRGRAVRPAAGRAARVGRAGRCVAHAVPDALPLAAPAQARSPVA
ncbi:hypothetical protein ABTL10_19585, partial [Acinetobacter baumannii]